LRNKINDGRVPRFDGLGIVLQFLTGTTINFFLDFLEAAGDVSGVAVQYR